MVQKERSKRLTSKRRFINMTTIFCKVKNYFHDGMQRKKELHKHCHFKEEEVWDRYGIPLRYAIPVGMTAISFNESLGVVILK